MTEPTNKPPATQAAPPATPESEANSRINALQAEIAKARQELKTFEGKLANRTPQLANGLKKENEELKARLKLLNQALLGILIEGYKPRQAEDVKTQYEVLCLAAVDYFKKANIDPEIWKNIVS